VTLIGNDMVENYGVKAHFHAQFHIKDLSPLKFLFLEFALSQSGFILNEHKYCLLLLSEHGLTDCKPVSKPIDAF